MKIKIELTIKQAKEETLEDSVKVKPIHMSFSSEPDMRQIVEMEIPDSLFDIYYKAEKEDVIHEIMDDYVINGLLEWDYTIIEENK